MTITGRLIITPDKSPFSRVLRSERKAPVKVDRRDTMKTRIFCIDSESPAFTTTKAKISIIAKKDMSEKILPHIIFFINATRGLSFSFEDTLLFLFFGIKNTSISIDMEDFSLL
jgi:hypothetical protein